MSGSTSVSVHEVTAILNAARKQYLEVIDSSLPPVASCLTERLEEATSDGSGRTETIQLQHFDSTEPLERHSEWEDAPPETEQCVLNLVSFRTHNSEVATQI